MGVEVGKGVGEAMGVEVGNDVGVAVGGGVGVINRHAVRPTSATLMMLATRTCFRFMVGIAPRALKEKCLLRFKLPPASNPLDQRDEVHCLYLALQLPANVLQLRHAGRAGGERDLRPG